jgi:EpsI family protein
MVSHEVTFMLIKCKISNKSYVVAFATLLVTLCLTIAISMRGKPSVVETNLEKLPMEICGMQGIDDTFSETVYKELKADVNVYRHYRSSNGGEVDLYIGYYGTAKGGRTGHNPIGCLPSQGWGLQESREIKLKCVYYPDGVPVNYLLSSKGDLSMTTIYWYQSASRKVLSNGIRQNIQRFLDMIFHNRNDGAFVRITLNADRKDAGAAKKRAEYFSEQILNLLPNYWSAEK